MANNNQNSEKGKIPVWLIVLGFCFSFWPGMILLGVRLWQDYSQRTNGAARRSDSEWAQNAQDATWREVDGQRSYRPPQQSQPFTGTSTSARYGKWNADGTYHYNYGAGRTAQPEQQAEKARQTAQTQTQAPPRQQTQQPRPRPSLLDHYKLNPRTGKGRRLAGAITLGSGAFVAALVMLGAISAGLFTPVFWKAILSSLICAMCICIPGAVLHITGSRSHDRVMRCRTYAAMLGDRRRMSIDELAAAIPTSYKRCCDDLNWMLSEGLLKGMYIDAAGRALTYPDASPVSKPEKPAAKATAPVPEEAAGRKAYPEETRIRQLNDSIQDEYVSQRMERLEDLTHQILSYADEHPEKEPQLRQFRNHYLPKTFSILESYARMERSGVEGGNIAAAMKDVEEIMDKLVQGFEKQLDALFDSEAMDVTSDITVLENMMRMEGLSDLDPFGSLKQDDDLLRR